MSGRQLSERPGLKVHHLADNTEDDVACLEVLQMDTTFLPEPFTPRALVFLVHEVLAR